MSKNRLWPMLSLSFVPLIAFVVLFAFLIMPAQATVEGEASLSAAAQHAIELPSVEAPAAPADHHIVASGLYNPRNLTFGPDGKLYVVEAGQGGDGDCRNTPEGVSCFGNSGGITQVEVDASGAGVTQTRIITDLVSLGLQDTGDAALGPQGIAFDENGDLYALVGLGADPALRTDMSGTGWWFGGEGPNFGQLISATVTGQWGNIVDIAQYEADNNPDMGPPDSNPYSMLPIGGDRFMVADAGANALFEVNLDGTITTTAIFPTRTVEFPPGSGNPFPMHEVPTDVEMGPDGAYYVSQLTGFPFPVGGARIYRVEPNGAPVTPTIYLDGFTNVIDIAFAADDSLYVLEIATNSLISGDPTGRIVRVNPDGSRVVVMREGLILPTGMTIGPDHALYVSNVGVSGTQGQVIRVPTELSEAQHFSAFLTSDQVTPTIESEASGVARFTLVNSTTLSYEIGVRDIAGIFAAHIHLGAEGLNGPIAHDLYTGTGDFDPDNPISGTLTLTETHVADLLAGDYYVNVHTSDHPTGEIRGQIYPATNLAMEASLSGANEVPPVDADASGQALFTLSPDMTQLYYRLFVADIASIGASHIHIGEMGANGPVTLGLYDGSVPFGPDDPVSGVVTPTITDLAAIFAGDTYVNVHTAPHGPGEIRGQIGPYAAPADYHALLTGDHEVPPVDTDAVGLGTFHLYSDLSTLDYRLAVTDIVSVTAAHLHTGWPDENGGVAIGLYDGSVPFGPGMPISGLRDLGAGHLLDLISGYYYANVHTAAHGPGEIRGQVGGASVFTAGLSGDNEVPPVETDAAGRAVMALSADASTMYYRLLVRDIVSITASHIHRGGPDENGPVVHGLYDGTGPFDPDNPVSGALPFTDRDVFDLLQGNFYVNVHTEAHGPGEIRGQLGEHAPHTHYKAHLSGDAEVPPVDTEASGEAHFTLFNGRNVLVYRMMVSDIVSITASHIHSGWPDENGPVVHFLYDGSRPFGPDQPVAGCLQFGAEHLVDLMTGYYYVNVHTEANPPGEIRGQIGSFRVNYMPALIP